MINNIQVNETNFEQLWIEVRQILWDKGYPLNYRKRRLREWFVDREFKTFADVTALAVSLHDSFQGTGRTRPQWTKEVLEKIKIKPGQHRRHIVMSSLMRTAVYSVTDKYKGSIADKDKLLEFYKSILEGYCLLYTDDIDRAEEAIVSLLHNYIPNLVPDSGAVNTAIGMLATKIKNILINNPSYKSDVLAADNVENFKIILNSLVNGFEKTTQELIIIDFINCLECYKGYTFEDILLELYDNMAFDIQTNISVADKIKEFIPVHLAFVACIEQPSIENLKTAIDSYLKVK